jgi:hypothetical membrane protein
MTALKIIKQFSTKYPLVGPLFWLGSIQYFIIQLIVASHWPLQHYSLGHNTISDLGNTACGVYGMNYICSPLHNLMNVSFIVLGLTMIAGSVLLCQKYAESKLVITGFCLMAVAGLGTILVGLFPENTISWLHIAGAAMPFFYGNLGLVILGLSLKIPRYIKIYTVISGIVALAGLILLISDHYLGIGPGGMERIVAYPQTVWLICFGFYSLLKKTKITSA